MTLKIIALIFACTYLLLFALFFSATIHTPFEKDGSYVVYLNPENAFHQIGLALFSPILTTFEFFGIIEVASHPYWNC